MCRRSAVRGTTKSGRVKSDAWMISSVSTLTCGNSTDQLCRISLRPPGDDRARQRHLEAAWLSQGSDQRGGLLDSWEGSCGQLAPITRFPLAQKRQGRLVPL